MNDALVSTAALPDVAAHVHRKFLGENGLDPKYTKRSQIVMLEEVAKILQMPLMSKKLFEVTNSESQKITSKF